MIIKASASLRNKYSEISKLAHDSDEPIFITKNGEGDLVLMSIEKYEKMIALMKLLPQLGKAEQRIDNGEYYSLDEFKAKIDKLFDEHKVAEESEDYHA